MDKPLRTAEQIRDLLTERIQPAELQQEKPLFWKVVPADPSSETNGANWKVSYGPAEGNLKTALNRVTHEIQAKFDLAPDE